MSKDAAARRRAAEKRKKRELEMRRKKAQARTPEVKQEENANVIGIQDLPLVECVISKGWEERGLAHILLARRFPDGNLLVAGYYVDTLCLGIKDSALLDKLTEENYRESIKPTIFNDSVEFVDCDPSLAMAVVMGAAEYGERLGFKPNKRWADASKMFAGIELPEVKPVFGRDGKPCYVRRDETNSASIIARLERKAGPGNYTVV